MVMGTPPIGEDDEEDDGDDEEDEQGDVDGDGDDNGDIRRESQVDEEKNCRRMKKTYYNTYCTRVVLHLLYHTNCSHAKSSAPNCVWF